MRLLFHGKTASVSIVILFLILLLIPGKAWSADNQPDAATPADSLTKATKTPLLVVINSYNETKPRVVDIEPIVKAASHHKVKINIEHLETTRVRNDSLYNITVNTVFSKYRENKPDYVVVVGGLAITMLDRIHDEWGDDIPIVYVGLTNRIGRREDYFTNIRHFVDFSTWQPVDSIFKNQNILFVSQPYFPEKTVDLMVNSMPNLRKIIFLGDEKWTNRYLDQHVKSYIKEKYPHLKYEWELCTSEHSDFINRIIAKPHNFTGLLLSTWSYERPGALGYPVLITQDYNSIATSPNPVFTLSPMYLSLGAAGGHFYDEEIFSQNVRSAIDHMVRGDRLDTIPHIKAEKGTDIINYERYAETRHAFGSIPDDVKIINEPPSLWDRYMWIIIIVAIIMIAILVVMHIITKDQRQKAYFFSQLDNIIQGMPVAFLTVNVRLDENKRIVSYDFAQTNHRYRDLLRENDLLPREGEYYCSVRDVLLEKIQEAMLEPENQAITYTRFFQVSGKTYEWMFKRDPHLDKCYIYAVDISELADSKRNLASIKGQLEIALLSARLIPWIWDIPNKRVAYDRIRTCNSHSRSLNDTTESRRGYIDNKRLVKLIHPDDRVKLANAFNDVVSGKKRRWEGYLRIADNTMLNPDHYHNAKITALASETDENGKAVAVTGAILIEHDHEARYGSTLDKTAANPADSKPETQNKNIIIIEPYDSNYILYDAILSKDYKVFRARTAEEALSMLSSVNPGLVVINIDYDDSDIIRIEQTVNSIHSETPVVAITSQASATRSFSNDVRRRFTSTITLPVTPRNFLNEISRLI